MDAGTDSNMAARRRGSDDADWRSTLARAGLVAKGVLYGALGVLAINVASGDAGSQSASRQGAIELVASQPLGQWLLGILTAGLFALALWQAIMAITGDPVEGSEAKDRAKAAGTALLYLGTAITSLRVLMAHWGAGSAGGSGSGGGGSREDQATAVIMGWPGGPWIVGIVGLLIVGVALYGFRKHAVNKAFMRRLDRAAIGADLERGIERTGQAGYAARAMVAVIAGVLLVVAAVQQDPEEAAGLSGALAALPQESWGQAILWFIALGLALYGAFCFAEARYRRAT